MKLKVYADRMSQPSRAVIIFCKVNGIDFEEVRTDITKRQQLSPEFKEINPMGKVPAIVDGRFKLFESHAILIYLACVFPGVADHWQQVLDENDHNRILAPYEKVQQWIKDTRYATRPHFDEVHKILFKAKARLQKQRSTGENSETQLSLTTTLPSKM